jgi:hypothetical protein
MSIDGIAGLSDKLNQVISDNKIMARKITELEKKNNT